MEVLESPEKYIISKGGQILFAELEGEIIGTVALVPEEKGVFELAKMAVSQSRQGKGIGQVLLKEAIQYCDQLGIKKLFLVSNSKLKSAIHLYEKHGFIHKPMCNDTPYSRCDVRMELDFSRKI
jgi:N-acetylglutamate synthase-like GNAT family acetyltransferase